MLASGAMLRLLAASRRGLLAPEQVQELETAALRLVESLDIPTPARVSALQVCAQLGCSKTRETALKLAQSDTEPFPLRIAAIAALGDLENSSDVVEFLKETSSGPNKRLQPAAISALQRLEKKQS